MHSSCCDLIQTDSDVYRCTERSGRPLLPFCFPCPFHAEKQKQSPNKVLQTPILRLATNGHFLCSIHSVQCTLPTWQTLRHGFYLSAMSIQGHRNFFILTKSTLSFPAPTFNKRTAAHLNITYLPNLLTDAGRRSSPSNSSF